jgi:nitrous oxide reductase accessory protein NosL
VLGVFGGVFALLNAKEITDMLIEGKSHDEIIEKLNYKLTLEELKEIRTIFAKILENDAEWKQNQSSVLEDTCVSQVGEKKRS